MDVASRWWRRLVLSILLVGTTCVAITSAAHAACDPVTEVQFQGMCYYLDGSGGVCDPGYRLAPQSVLLSIATGFAGKTYKHQVSDNCCIFNSEPDEDWGMSDDPGGHCNQPGFFNPDEPSLGGANCNDDTNLRPNQLTLCQSIATSDAPTLSAWGLLLLGTALGGAGFWLQRRRLVRR